MNRITYRLFQVEVLSMKSTITNNGKVFNDRFEFVDKQENRIGKYETNGQVLVAWKDDYLAIFKNQKQIEDMQPKLFLLKKINARGFGNHRF